MCSCWLSAHIAGEIAFSSDSATANSRKVSAIKFTFCSFAKWRPLVYNENDQQVNAENDLFAPH